MIKQLKEFNDLLNRKPGARVGVIESDGDTNVDSGVFGKDSPNELKEAIELAIKESLDYEDIAIKSVTIHDGGYKLTIIASCAYDDEVKREETYYITHVFIY